MDKLGTDELIELYQKAFKLGIDKDFLELIQFELMKRKMKSKI
jgi:hypothetical protein